MNEDYLSVANLGYREDHAADRQIYWIRRAIWYFSMPLVSKCAIFVAACGIECLTDALSDLRNLT